MKKGKQSIQTSDSETRVLPVLTREQRERIHDNIKQISLRTITLNPMSRFCMQSVIDFVDRGELVLAVEFFFQEISNFQDFAVDVSVYDLMYMMHASYILGSRHYRLEDFQFLEKVVEMYE